jgi:hypothetical protein
VPTTGNCAESSPRALKDIYFQDGESRATGLSDAEINDIDHLDLDY